MMRAGFLLTGGQSRDMRAAVRYMRLTSTMLPSAATWYRADWGACHDRRVSLQGAARSGVVSYDLHAHVI